MISYQLKICVGKFFLIIFFLLIFYLILLPKKKDQTSEYFRFCSSKLSSEYSRWFCANSILFAETDVQLALSYFVP